MKVLAHVRSAAAAIGLLLAVTAPGAAAPWLFVSDVHLEPRLGYPLPSHVGLDTNGPLLESAIGEMQRVDPDPPVVVIPGDFLGHSIAPRDTIPTVTYLAQRFGRAFPHAQFLIALGNEDSGCADYGIARNSAFLRAAARAWAPLVNRRGAAPDFARTFAVDGSYTASLPLRATSAVVIDDAVWSPRYHAACGAAITHGVPLHELDRYLRRDSAEHYWLLIHIPPGIDAYSTVDIGHRLVVVPFLDPGSRETFEGIVDDPSRHVQLVVAGHIHRFSYRILGADGADPIPLITVPALSPIFGNSPGFLTGDVRPDGTLAWTEEYSYLGGRWTDLGGSRTLDVASYTGKNLLALQSRLDASQALRDRYSGLYGGYRHPFEILDWSWPAYRCTAVAFSAAAFRECTRAGGFSIFTARGLEILGTALVVAAVLLGMIVVAIRNAIAARARRA